MNDEVRPADGPGPDGAGEHRANTSAQDRADRDRRRRQVFGDVLDGSTLDDRPDPAVRPEIPDGDRWLRDNVPPHHGG